MIRHSFASANPPECGLRRKRIVIKIGSNILADKKTGLDANRISAICADVCEIIKMGFQAILVSSGAVAAGMYKLGLKEKPKDIQLKQAAAAIGQSSLIRAYEKSFAIHEKKVAQILLTREDFSDRKRYINSKNTLLTLLSYGVVPIINENDTVAVDEIRFGDNDQLAAMVAGIIDADRLVILSDVDGLYTNNPQHDQNAKLISTVEKITPEIESIAGSTGSSVGTGGMYSKVIAAKKAISSGVTVNIINGKKSGLIVSLLRARTQLSTISTQGSALGQSAISIQGSLGTEFRATDEKLSARKGWIVYGSRSKGTLQLDEGAVKALISGGSSLLPSGISIVSGNFEIGDAVHCIGLDGKRIAKGITNYSALEIKKIKGKKTSEIEKILGYRYSDEVINRDNLVVF
jgi:glutamate 5-kinase